MAVTDAYTTAALYRAAINMSDTTKDVPILAQLKGVSRYIDWKLGRYFTIDAAQVVRLFNGNGARVLWLTDQHQRQVDIGDKTSIEVKIDDDGDYSPEQALVEDTDYWVGPDNATAGSEAVPYQFVEVHPDSTLLGVWPAQRRAVSIKAKFGWPAIPQAIADATISLTRMLRDTHEAGVILTLEQIDAAVRLSAEPSKLMDDLLNVYRARRIAF